MSALDRIKVAVIGAGGWGRQHARLLERPDVDFCAVVGRTPEKTQAPRRPVRRAPTQTSKKC